MDIKKIEAVMDFAGIKYKCIKSVSDGTNPKIVYEMIKGKQNQVIRYSTIMDMCIRKMYMR